MSEGNLGGEAAIIEERRKKLKALRENAKAYINDFDRLNRAADIIDQYNDASKKDLEKEQVDGLQVAGRIILKRVMGNASFMTIRDELTDIQIYASKNNLGEETYTEFKTWDIGDIVGIGGRLFRTKTDELTIDASQAVMITKSLRPMPEKHKGLSDVEIRYRQRYVDLMSSNDSKELFQKRSRIVDSIRNTMKDDQYMEVETPMMHSLPGGAVARPFITKHNALSRDLYLRVAPELHLKRLLVGGFDRVFEINRSFRNEGLSTKHNPEFTMLEFYAAHAKFNDILDFVASLIKNAAASIKLNNKEIEWDGKKIDLSNFKTHTLTSLVKEHNSELKDIDIKDLKYMKNFALSKGIKSNKSDGWGKILLELFEKTVEDHLIQPTFVTEYPVEISPLSRRNNADADFADRFELFIGGKEIANGFCELNDPDDQAERFHDQVKAAKAGDKEAMSFDEDYITALEYGMPPAVGVGIGIDRLVMLLTNSSSIRDVLLFPQMKD
tara:strand:- start:4280 stop:5773 length:1494 start_codon:yes stop_codon:yes gene_type:complete